MGHCAVKGRAHPSCRQIAAGNYASAAFKIVMKTLELQFASFMGIPPVWTQVVRGRRKCQKNILRNHSKGAISGVICFVCLI